MSYELAQALAEVFRAVGTSAEEGSSNQRGHQHMSAEYWFNIMQEPAQADASSPLQPEDTSVEGTTPGSMYDDSDSGSNGADQKLPPWRNLGPLHRTWFEDTTDDATSPTATGAAAPPTALPWYSTSVDQLVTMSDEDENVRRICTLVSCPFPLCGSILPADVMANHCCAVHFKANARWDRVDCPWAGCQSKLRLESLGKHLESAVGHLQVMTYHCPHCHGSWRSDLLPANHQRGVDCRMRATALAGGGSTALMRRSCTWCCAIKPPEQLPPLDTSSHRVKIMWPPTNIR